jgi:N-acetylneuraminate synthase
MKKNPPRKRCIIIAEAGVNHNGSLKIAQQLVRAAAQARADYIKFQIFDPEELASQSAPQAPYQKKGRLRSGGQLGMLRRLALHPSCWATIQKACQRQGLGFLATSFDFESLLRVERLQPAFHKISSGDLDNLPYLRAVARLGRPILLSTGMGTMQEIRQALRVLTKEGTPKSRITVLHCHSEYPTLPSDVNLRAMLAIRRRFGVKVGYSDHTAGLGIPVSAVAIGAGVIEKHLTLNRKMKGPDHQASLEPGDFAAMVCAIREFEQALGDGIKRPTPRELRNRFCVRKSIVARGKILRGEIFTEQNLALQRPASGLSPAQWDRLIGKRAKKTFRPGAAIRH